MIMQSYKAALGVLSKKPFVLWGLSLMCGLLGILVNLFCALLPFVSMPIQYTLKAGMSLIYLDGLKGKEVNSDQLFAGFKQFWHVAGGMAWMSLWILIWSLVPIAGFVLGIYKGYCYRFVPYILMTRPDISATEALRVSMRETAGKKGSIFGAEILFYVGAFVLALFLILFAQIPLLGGLFALALALFAIVFFAFQSLFMGLVDAYFYENRYQQRVYTHYAPYGAPYGAQQPPRPPYGAPYGAPQAPNGAPQAPYPPYGTPKTPQNPQQ